MPMLTTNVTTLLKELGG